MIEFHHKILRLLILGLFIIAQITAQPIWQYSSSVLKNKMNGLNECGRVLYLAAHPDDENTRLISYLANELHYTTAYLSLTRGDGGQNLIGKEQGTALGMIRSNELLEARKIDGGLQFFTRAFDFGYSKNPDETFSIWNKDSILADVVWIIRNFKPNVIICRFPTTGEGGHGHHTASAILAQEAFKAAADSLQFPNQLTSCKVWQTQKLYWNTFNFGNRNTTSDDQLKIEVGNYNPLLGLSYGEMAALSRSKHSSQAFGSARNRSSQIEYFKQLEGVKSNISLFDGINTSLHHLSNDSNMVLLNNKLINNFDYQNPSQSIPDLLSLYQEVEQNKSLDAFLRSQKLQEISMVIANAAGIWLDAYTTSKQYCPGDTASVVLHAVNRSKINIQLNEVTIGNNNLLKAPLALHNKTMMDTIRLAINLNEKCSQPYWLLHPIENGMFSLPNLNYLNSPINDPSFIASFKLLINNKELIYYIPLRFKDIDPAKGEIYEPLIIMPKVTLEFEKPMMVLSHSKKPVEVKVKLKAHQKNLQGSVRLELPNNWTIEPQNRQVDFSKSDEVTCSFSIFPKNNITDLNTQSLAKAMFIENRDTFVYDHHKIKYDHIPEINYFTTAATTLINKNFKTIKKSIGYLSGAGDKIPEVLSEIGYNLSFIAEQDLTINYLQQFQTIIIGIRAYNTLQHLVYTNALLLDYVYQGGTLIVQYNTTGDLIMSEIGPYPFKISRKRVTNEKAKVKITNPQAAIFNYPNKILDADFENWVQERGLYFLENLDEKYENLLLMHDDGEEDSSGSLIEAKYGKGKYIYTSLSFFRQLPAGVTGSLKLFCNLIEQ